MASAEPVEGEFDSEEKSTGYIVPKKVALDDLNKLDADDEAMVKYKEQLLGNITNVQDEGGNNVIVLKMAFCATGKDSIEYDLRGDLKSLKSVPIIIKEGCEYFIQIHFKVQREIVSGLHYKQASYRKGVRVDKSDVMLGSYGPKELHIYASKPSTAPSGMLARGEYNVKSRFTDDDNSFNLEWEWRFEIKKDWD